MRGSASPLRTRRSSASDDGRVLVGSSPTRLYIVRTAAISGGGLARTPASAAARGASIRGSQSTTIASSSHNTPARTIDATPGATVNVTSRRPADATAAQQVRDGSHWNRYLAAAPRRP